MMRSHKCLSPTRGSSGLVTLSRQFTEWGWAMILISDHALSRHQFGREDNRAKLWWTMMSGNWLSRKVTKIKNMWTSNSNNLYFPLKFLPVIAIYVNGLYGMGWFSLAICLTFGVASFYFHDRREMRVKGNTSAAWYQDTNLERVEWINKILQELWPHLDNFLKNLSSESFLVDGMFQ